MLSYAYQDLQKKNYEKIESESFENTQDLFAAILAIGIASQLKQGLSREYIERQDELSTLKGKIDIKKSFSLKMRNEQKLACIFDDLSENHYMNQILKSAALFLINDSGVQRKNKEILKKSILFFSNVNTMEPSTINWQSLHYNRGNSSYRMLMNICYLILHELLPTTEDGERKLATFFDDQKMSRLYEKFILEYYKKHFSQFSPSSRKIKWNATGTVDYLPDMESDVMLVDNTNRKRKLIIDAKYYGSILQKQYDTETIRSNNLYQIFAYVKNEDKNNTGLVDGMLLYAKTDEYRLQNLSYNFEGNKITIATLDLAKSFSDIKKQLDSLIEQWQKAE